MYCEISGLENELMLRDILCIRHIVRAICNALALAGKSITNTVLLYEHHLLHVGEHELAGGKIVHGDTIEVHTGGH